mmetsp:Transcript_12600/g.36495  ORF Transcript_12600/g.36495 Transcript_12600/m.36495 type:complete len:221 (+) Transcript_12600:227-889(+)
MKAAATSSPRPQAEVPRATFPPPSHLPWLRRLGLGLLLLGSASFAPHIGVDTRAHGKDNERQCPRGLANVTRTREARRPSPSWLLSSSCAFLRWIMEHRTLPSSPPIEASHCRTSRWPPHAADITHVDSSPRQPSALSPQLTGPATTPHPRHPGDLPRVLEQWLSSPLQDPQGPGHPGAVWRSFHLHRALHGCRGQSPPPPQCSTLSSSGMGPQIQGWRS